MKCSGLTCRCGSKENWSLNWSYDGEWNLSLECDCGAVYYLGKSKNEKISVSDFVYKKEI
jgi:hypothetical protein